MCSCDLALDMSGTCSCCLRAERLKHERRKVKLEPSHETADDMTEHEHDTDASHDVDSVASPEHGTQEEEMQQMPPPAARALTKQASPIPSPAASPSASTSMTPTAPTRTLVPLKRNSVTDMNGTRRDVKTVPSPTPIPADSSGMAALLNKINSELTLTSGQRTPTHAATTSSLTSRSISHPQLPPAATVYVYAMHVNSWMV